MNTDVLRLLYSSFKLGSLGSGGLLKWVAVQKRLKATASVLTACSLRVSAP